MPPRSHSPAKPSIRSPSRSRTYLTATNSKHQSIHTITDDAAELNARLARNDALRNRRPLRLAQPNHTAPPVRKACPLHLPSKPVSVSAMAEVGVYDDPLSSSDDEHHTKRGTSEVIRCKPVAESRRASKRRKIDQHSAKVVAHTNDTLAERQSFPDLAFLRPSQSSQTRSSQKYLSQTSQKKKLIPIAELALTPEKKRLPVKLDAVPDPSESPTLAPRPNGNKVANIALPVSEHEALQTGLNIPLLDDDELNDVASSIDSQRGSTFSRPPDRPNLRRDSTSSLSSTDSVIEHIVPDNMKSYLMNDDESATNKSGKSVPNTHFLCPVCNRVTLRAGLKGLNRLARLPLAAQQRLCREHRIRDAKDLCREKGYPALDWPEVLSSDRLRRHLADLSNVILRKKKSFYLQSLDDAIQRAGGQQKQINLYFDLHVLDLVHQGYFGPKGAKLFSECIARDVALQRLLSKQSRSDKAIRIAGVGRFVQVVLLPELMTNILMDDTGIVDPNEARAAMEESQEVGVLLQPDDDQVDLSKSRDDDSIW